MKFSMSSGQVLKYIIVDKQKSLTVIFRLSEISGTVKFRDNYMFDYGYYYLLT